MGLDVTAYKKLKVVECPQLDKYGELVNWETEWRPGASMEWSEKHFKGRGEGVVASNVYTYEDSFDFRAGTYSGYNFWRAKLDEFKGSEAFQELINFADNEGVIGYVISKKLLEDFKKYEKEAEEFSKTFDDVGDGKWFIRQYRVWMKAFEMASDGGAVSFH